MRDVQNWLWYRKEMQRALRGSRGCPKGRDHFDGEGLGRKFSPSLRWHDSVSPSAETATDKMLDKAMGRIWRAYSSCSSWHQGKWFKTNLNQTWLCIHITWGFVLFCFLRAGRGVLFKSGFWFSRSGWACGPAFLTSPQVMLTLPVRYFE